MSKHTHTKLLELIWPIIPTNHNMLFIFYAKQAPNLFLETQFLGPFSLYSVSIGKFLFLVFFLRVFYLWGINLSLCSKLLPSISCNNLQSNNSSHTMESPKPENLSGLISSPSNFVFSFQTTHQHTLQMVSNHYTFPDKFNIWLWLLQW